MTGPLHFVLSGHYMNASHDLNTLIRRNVLRTAQSGELHVLALFERLVYSNMHDKLK